MKIEILGTGCPNCKKVEKNIRQAVRELQTKTEINKITEMSEIVRRGVMSLPAVMIDDELKISGRIPDVEEIKKLLTNS